MKRIKNLTIVLFSLIAFIMLGLGIIFGMPDSAHAKTYGADLYEGAVSVASVTTADGVTDYPTLADAVTNAPSGAEITLNTSVSESITIGDGKNIIIDLGGNTLTAEASGVAAILNEGGTVTVKNGTVLRTAETEYYVIKNHSGAMTLENLTVSNLNIQDGASLICNESDGLAEDQKATLTVKSGSYTAVHNQSAVIKNGAADELFIEGGNFSLDGALIVKGFNPNTVLSYGDITVTGGTFSISKAEGSYKYGRAHVISVMLSDADKACVKKADISNAVINSAEQCYGINFGNSLNATDLTVNITDCTISNSQYAVYLASLKGTHKINISNTTAINGRYGIYISAGSETAKIAASFTNNNTESAAVCGVYLGGNSKSKPENVKYEITGGTYKTPQENNPANISVAIGEGTAFCEIPALHCNTTPIAYLEDGSGKFVASSYADAVNAGYAVTYIGKPFIKLQEAIDAFTSDSLAATFQGPILLHKDVSECVSFASTKFETCILDLNGHTLSAAESAAAITVLGKVSLIIKNGRVSNTSGNDAFLVKDTKLTVESGEITGGILNDNGIVNIVGGDINGEFSVSGEEGSYSISGGKFAILPDESFLDPNYVLKQDGGKYSAILLSDALGEGYTAKAGALAFKSLQAAIDFAGSDEATVKLIADATESVTIGGTQIIILDLNEHTLFGVAGQPAITNNGRITVDGGTVTADASQAAILNCATAKIVGGIYNGELAVSGGSYSISGGKFSVEPDASYLDENVKIEVDGGYYIAISAVAKIGEVYYYTTLSEAVAAAASGETVLLLKNVTENITVTDGQNIIIDLGGNTITAETSGVAAILNEGGTVTVKNGTITRADGTEYYVIKNRVGAMTLENLTVSNLNIQDGASLICNESDGLAEDQKATLTVKSGTYTARHNQSNVIKNGAADELFIEGGNFNLIGGKGGAQAILTSGDITVTGGTFKVSRDRFLSTGIVSAIYVGIAVSSTPYVKNVNVSNATIECTKNCGYGIYVGGSVATSSVSVNITNCTISNASNAIDISKIKGTLTINISDTTTEGSTRGIYITSGSKTSVIDATLSNNTDTTSTTSINFDGYASGNAGLAKIKIESGTYKNIKDGLKAQYITIIISGGTFIDLPILFYNAAPNKVYLYDEVGGKYVVSSYADAVNAGYAAAWIGHPHRTLQEAITESLNSKDPIILLKDVTECISFASGTTRVLNLNGFTLTGGTMGPAITNAATLTILNGTVTAAEGQPAILNSATVKIGDGVFNGELLLSVDGSYSISGGKFSALPSENYLASGIGVKHDESGYHTALPLAEAATGAVARIGDYFFFTTLGDAVADAPTGVTVFVLADLTECVTVGEGKDFTLDLCGFTLTNGADSSTITNEGTLTITNGTLICDSESHPVILNKKNLTVAGGTFTASGKTSVTTESGKTTIGGGEFNGGLSIGSENDATCIVFGGAYTVSSLADLSLDKIKVERGYVAYISVPLVSTFALYATDPETITVTVSDISTAQPLKAEIEIVAGRGDEDLSDLGFTINEKYAQVLTETGYEVVDFETYKDIAIAEVSEYAVDVGLILEESYTAAIEAATTYAEVDRAVAAAKKHMDRTAKIAQARQEACKYVMSYAMTKNVEYTTEIDSIINADTVVTLLDIERAKSAAMAKVDEIYEAAKTEKDNLEQAKRNALSEIRSAAAATEATETEPAKAAVRIPASTIATIESATDIDQVAEFKLTALAEIANVRAIRTRIEKLKADGEGAIKALDALKKTLPDDNAKNFDAAKRSVEGMLDLVKQDISLYTESELLNAEIKVKESILNAVNVLELAIGDYVLEITKSIESVQNKVKGAKEAFGINTDIDTSEFITDGLNKIKTDVTQLSGNLLADYNETDGVLKAANTAIVNAKGEIDSLGLTVTNAVKVVMGSGMFKAFVTEADLAELNAALTDFGKYFKIDEENDGISPLKSALVKAVAVASSATEELAAKLGFYGTDVSGIESELDAIETDKLFSLAEYLENVQAEIESAIEDCVAYFEIRLTEISEDMGTLTGKLKEDNSVLGTEIEELGTDLEGLDSESFESLTAEFTALRTEFELIDKKVGTAVGVEAEKTKAYESIKKTFSELIGETAASATRESSNDLTDAQREKLNNLFGEGNAKIIEAYYKEANTAVSNATTTDEVEAATNEFKRGVSVVVPVSGEQQNKPIYTYIIYIMLGVVLILLIAIMFIVLFNKRGKEENYDYKDTEGWNDEYDYVDDGFDDDSEYLGDNSEYPGDYSKYPGDTEYPDYSENPKY